MLSAALSESWPQSLFSSVCSCQGPRANLVPTQMGADDPGVSKRKVIDQQNRNLIREDVAKLYEMASELKGEVEKTDASSTLSVSLVKKAQQIEKLAKEIKNLAKG